MFSRRHPVLFFLLLMSAMFSVVVVSFAGLFVAGSWVINSAMVTKAGPRNANVGIVEINGVITSSKKWIRQIRQFRDNDAIKAIIVRIDSPGGGIGPSQELYREIMKTKEKKHVVSSMGSVAASGGYYISAACDRIVANSGTITGSIGVIMQYANIEEIIEKIGLVPVVVKSGDYKDTGSPLREITSEERKFLQDIVDELHQQFVQDVAKGRGLNLSDLSSVSDGRILTGKTALDMHLVDRIGNLEDAVQLAGELAGIDPEKVVPVYPPEDTISLFRKMADTLLKNINITGPVSDNFRFVIN